MDTNGLLWILLYIFMNLMTTVLNKAILQTFDFPYPEVLTLWHYSCTATGSLLLVRVFKIIKPAELDGAAHRKLFLFSVLFNINILVSIVSLHMVSMALHQIVRALSPAFTMGLSMLVLNKSYTHQIYVAVIVIFFGVTIYASKGEVDYTMIGLIVTLSGCLLAALKGVLTNLFMVGPLKLHPFDLLQYMSTYAFLQLALVLGFSGTLQKAYHHVSDQSDSTTIMMLLLNGGGAFLLNIVSFNANKKTSPLAMSIGAIAKQVMAIIIGFILFAAPVTFSSVLGVAVTIAGIIWYTYASYQSRMAPKQAQDILPIQSQSPKTP